MENKLLFTAVIGSICTLSTGFAHTHSQQSYEVKMEEAIIKQIGLLEHIHPILKKIDNQESADREATKLDKLCKEYKQAKRDEDIAEAQLPKRQADAIEDKYERQLDRIEDKVEDLAEELYERKKGYGSEALMRAIHAIAD